MREGKNKTVEIFYFALLSLSASFSTPVCALFTMSHLTVPGAMASIRSITGRLVLISLSCRKQGNGLITNVFTQIHHTNTCTHAPWSCWSAFPFFSGSRWCWPSWGWSDLQPSLHHPDLTKPALCTWRMTSRIDVQGAVVSNLGLLID